MADSLQIAPRPRVPLFVIHPDAATHDDLRVALAGIADAIEVCATVEILLERVRDGGDVVVVLSTALAAVEDACRAIRAGFAERGLSAYLVVWGSDDAVDTADDVVGSPVAGDALRSRIRVGLRLLAAERDLDQARERLRELGGIDPCTGLPCADRGLQIVSSELSQVRRGLKHLSVCMIELDGFSEMAEKHGLPSSDAVLEAAAHAVRLVCRDYDTLVRWHGPRFVAILPSTASEHAPAIGERMREAVASLSVRLPDGTTLRPTASVGTASAGASTQLGAEALLQVARTALERARACGGDCVYTGGVSGLAPRHVA